jgi:hypothetical protein
MLDSSSVEVSKPAAHSLPVSHTHHRQLLDIKNQGALVANPRQAVEQVQTWMRVDFRSIRSHPLDRAM